jgi:hypothetical protein
MEADELVVQKWRNTQQYSELSFPQHFEYATSTAFRYTILIVFWLSA